MNKFMLIVILGLIVIANVIEVHGRWPMDQSRANEQVIKRDDDDDGTGIKNFKREIYGLNEGPDGVNPDQDVKRDTEDGDVGDVAKRGIDIGNSPLANAPVKRDGITGEVKFLDEDNQVKVIEPVPI